jgi:integrase
MNCCAKRKMCDPAPVFDKYDEGERRMFWFTQDQVENMCLAALDPYARDKIADIIVTAAYTGMRQGELLKLRAQDIDLDGAAPRIHVGGVPHLKTKAKNYRTVPIHPRVRSVLSKRLEHASPSVKVFDDVGNKDQLLAAFKKVRDYAQVPPYNFHDLRHSFGTWHALVRHAVRRSACTVSGALGENDPSSRANGPRAPLARSFDPLSSEMMG